MVSRERELDRVPSKVGEKTFGLDGVLILRVADNPNSPRD
jgi:hypothetical protein